MKCPICNSEDLLKKNIETQEEVSKHNIVLLECLTCGLAFLENYKKDRAYIYDSNYAAWHKSEDNNEIQIAKAKKMAFQYQLKSILKYIDPKNKKILDIGTGNGYLLDIAEQMGFDCFGIELSDYSADIASKKFPNRIYRGELADGKYEDNYFDIVSMTDVIEHLNNPDETMKEIGRILKPDGLLFIISPNFNSITRKILGKRWFQYKYEHILYFNKKSLSVLLEKLNFELIEYKNNIKKFSLHYYYFYFEKYSFMGIGKIFRFLFPLLPRFIKNIFFINPLTGEFLAIAKKKLKNEFYLISPNK